MNVGDDAATEDKLWRQIIRIRRQECHKFNIPIFVTRHTVAQLRNPHAHWRERRAIWTRIQEGMREIERKREEQAVPAMLESPGKAPGATYHCKSHNEKQKANLEGWKRRNVKAIAAEERTGPVDLSMIPTMAADWDTDQSNLELSDLSFTADSGGFLPTPNHPFLLRRLDEANARWVYNCLLCNKSHISRHTTLQAHLDSHRKDGTIRKIVVRTIQFSNTATICRLCSSARGDHHCRTVEGNAEHWATSRHQEKLASIRALAERNGYMRVFFQQRSNSDLCFRWACVPCQLMRVSPWPHSRDDLHKRNLETWEKNVKARQKNSPSRTGIENGSDRSSCGSLIPHSGAGTSNDSELRELANQSSGELTESEEVSVQEAALSATPGKPSQTEERRDRQEHHYLNWEPPPQSSGELREPGEHLVQESTPTPTLGKRSQSEERRDRQEHRFLNWEPPRQHTGVAIHERDDIGNSGPRNKKRTATLVGTDNLREPAAVFPKKSKFTPATYGPSKQRQWRSQKS